VELPGKGSAAQVTADLFDACTNVRVGSAVLRAHLDGCTRSHSVTTLATPVEPARLRTAAPEALRLCALRKYAADLGVDGFAEAVLSYLPRQRLFGSADGFAPTTSWPGPSNACLCEEPRPRRRPPRDQPAREPRGTAEAHEPRDTRESTPPPRLNPSSSPILE
jgi:hypothetical protein